MIPTLTGAHTERLQRILLLEPLGRWDATNALAFLQWTQSLERERRVILSMEKMLGMDAAAYEYLIQLLTSLLARGGEVALVGPRPQILAQLQESGLDCAFAIFATRDEAVSYLRRRLVVEGGKRCIPCCGRERMRKPGGS